jgi:hypothetical protein
LNGTLQILTFADDVNVLGESIKEYAKAVLMLVGRLF